MKTIKMFYKIIIILSCLLTGFNCLYAKGAGSNSGENILQSPGVRQMGIGGGGTAVSGDIYSIYQNPAGISIISEKQVSSVLENGLSNDYKASIVFGHGVSGQNKYGIAFAVSYFNGGPMEINYIDGTSKNVLSQSDFLAMLGWSMYTASNISMGYNIKYLSSQLIENYNSSAVAFDAGIIAENTTNKRLKLGLAAQNFGTSLKYRSKKETLPALIRGGLSYIIPIDTKSSLLTVIDGFYLIDESNFYKSLGAEYSMSDRFFLRGGLKILPDRRSFTFGMGLKLYEKYNIDLASEPNSINNIYKVSFTMKFGGIEHAGSKVIGQKQELSKLEEEKKYEYENIMEKIAVVDFEGKSVSHTDASIVTDFLRTELVNIGAFNIIEKNNMDKILADALFQQSECSTSDCAVVIGKIVNVKKILIGSLSKTDDAYFLTVNLVEVDTGKVIKSEDSKAYSIEEFKDISKSIAQRISQ
ncbi:MAG: hypothetical protein A2539_10040 [Elusimicrobia bacterium RIFOXYD2_FULL_34_15]|nr:MAG: hypothetical protein A2539_10040 [Elusimicrobia bacterium RIFOXYD2_FULL_34_15]